MKDLSVNFASLKLKNPIIVGSSGLTDSLEGIMELERANAAAIVLKSLFEEEIVTEMKATYSSMSSEGFIYPETMDYFDHIEQKEELASRYLDLISDVKKKSAIPVIASINCVTADQWTFFPEQIELAGADAIELNLFILPSDFKRSAEENEKIYFTIIEEVLKKTKLPVIAKLSFYFSNLGTFLQKISKTGIKGLVLFNKFYNLDFDIDTFEISSGGVLSNPSDLYLSLRWISIMSGRAGCDLAASTGVHDGKALIKQLLAGAQAVEIASTLYKNGNGQISILLNELENWMEKKKYNSIEDFRGKLNQANSDDPASFERVQFMKYFRGFKG